jgi:hypothetical protein
LSGAFSAYSSYSQGKAQESSYLFQAAQYENQAAVAERNRLLAEQQASESLKEGAREEGRFRRSAEQFKAAQKSQLAASGVQMSGSALNVMADTAMGIEQDANMIRYNTLKQKWGFDVQGVNYANEANAARASAANARTTAKSAKAAGLMGAAGSLLGTAANVWAQIPAKASGNMIQTGDLYAPSFVLSGTGISKNKNSTGLYKDWWKF